MTEAHRSVDGYLRALARALAGADKALIADALADAEEHLRAALAADGRPEPEAMPDVAAAYGAPQDVADAYRTSARAKGAQPARGAQTMTAIDTADAPPPAPRAHVNPFAYFFGAIVDPRAYLALLYMLIAFGTGIAYFVIAVTGVSLSAGLMILIVGPFFALAFLFLVRGIAFIEGRLVEWLLWEPMPRRQPYVEQPRGWARAFAAVKQAVADPRTWGTLFYMVLQFALGIAYFVGIVVGFALCFAAISAPLGYTFGDPEMVVFLNSHAVVDGVPFNEFVAREPWLMPALFVGGVLGVFVLLNLARGIGFLHGKLAKALLVKTPAFA